MDCIHQYRRISTYDKGGCIENSEESWEEAKKHVLMRKKAGRV